MEDGASLGCGQEPGSPLAEAQAQTASKEKNADVTVHLVPT